MRRFPEPALAALLLWSFALSGCSDVLEHARVTISYDPGPDQIALVGTNRKRVEDEFRSFSERNGYKCEPQMKRTEEIACRGPNDLRLTFQPSLNKHEFVAEFSWADVGGRTHEEFMSYVLNFKNAFSSIFGDDHVHLEEGA
jgi:hypothetical protein